MNCFGVTLLRDDKYDSTDGGVTSRRRGFDGYVLYLTHPGDDVVENTLARNRCPLLLKRRDNQGFRPIAIPLTPEAERVDHRTGERRVIGGMFGGNFIYTSDGRWRTKVCDGPIAVHDRYETQRVYNSMCD